VAKTSSAEPRLSRTRLGHPPSRRGATGLLEHDLRQPRHQTQFLGQWQEGRGPQQAAVGVQHAHQSLGADDPARVHVDDGLVQAHDAVVVESLTQLGLSLEAVRGGILVDVPASNTVPTAGLGCFQGLFGSQEETALRGLAVLTVGTAGGGRQDPDLAGQVHRLPDLFQEQMREVLGLLGAGEVRPDEHEGGPTCPRQPIAPEQEFLQTFCDLDQGPVADGEAETAIEQRRPIEIYQNYRQGASLLVGRGILRRSQQALPVEQTTQRVAGCLEPAQLLEGLGRRDIFQGDDCGSSFRSIGNEHRDGPGEHPG
jgi:hypothetical protein